MPNLERAREDWEAHGYCYFPDLFRDDELGRLREICDRVLEQWLSENEREAGANMAFLTEPRYFRDSEKDLTDLLELIADPRILDILRALSGQEPLFHNTQYFFEQRRKSWSGDWHRDTQFLADDPELEQRRMRGNTGVHFRIAFTDDPWLEYVPGSEKRWDTPEEWAIRKSEDPTVRASSDMPGKRSLDLKRGEALLFHAWGIHRGSYHTHPPRRTLDIIYGWGGICDYSPPPPTCFRSDDTLVRLSPGGKRFFGNFVTTYRRFWDSSPRGDG